VRDHLLLVVSAFSMSLFALGIPHAKAEDSFDSVARYAEALRAGDTLSIKSLIGGRLYEKREVLLDQNKEYPDFLRNFYDGAVFRISNKPIDLGARGQGVTVEVLFRDGNTSKTMAIVEQEPDGSWVIVDEVDEIP
jgi:hypothetical protein